MKFTEEIKTNLKNARKNLSTDTYDLARRRVARLDYALDHDYPALFIKTETKLVREAFNNKMPEDLDKVIDEIETAVRTKEVEETSPEEVLLKELENFSE